MVNFSTGVVAVVLLAITGHTAVNAKPVSEKQQQYLRKQQLEQQQEHEQEQQERELEVDWPTYSPTYSPAVNPNPGSLFDRGDELPFDSYGYA